MKYLKKYNEEWKYIPNKSADHELSNDISSDLLPIFKKMRVDGEKITVDYFDKYMDERGCSFELANSVMTDLVSKGFNFDSYEDEVNESVDIKENFDPENLSGDDKEVYDIVQYLCDHLYDYEFFNSWVDVNRIEPIITCIIDQTAKGHKFPSDKRYYISVSSYYDNKYKEIECGLEFDNHRGFSIIPINAEQSSHGFPASYGEEIYSFNRKTGEIKYDSSFFKI